LIALLNEGLGKPVGFVNALLYNLAGTTPSTTSSPEITATTKPRKAGSLHASASPDGANLLQALKT